MRLFARRFSSSEDSLMPLSVVRFDREYMCCNTRRSGFGTMKQSNRLVCTRSPNVELVREVSFT